MRARIALGAVVAVFLLMTLGNVVSATGSGLACPDWPLCHGSVVPPLRADVLIEYGHRLSALAATVLILAASVATLRGPAPAVPRPEPAEARVVDSGASPGRSVVSC